MLSAQEFLRRFELLIDGEHFSNRILVKRVNHWASFLIDDNFRCCVCAITSVKMLICSWTFDHGSVCTHSLISFLIITKTYKNETIITMMDDLMREIFSSRSSRKIKLQMWEIWDCHGAKLMRCFTFNNYFILFIISKFNFNYNFMWWRNKKSQNIPNFLSFILFFIILVLTQFNLNYFSEIFLFTYLIEFLSYISSQRLVWRL